MDDEIACKNCKFAEINSFIKRDADGEYIDGECHRWPPSAKPVPYRNFPTVGQHDWCGEFVRSKDG